MTTNKTDKIPVYMTEDLLEEILERDSLYDKVIFTKDTLGNILRVDLD